MEPEADDLTPFLSQVALPDHVREARVRQVEANESARLRYEANIQIHIEAHRRMVLAFETSIQWVGDELDLDLTGDTRPAALWQLASRCIGIMKLMLDALEWGYTEEIVFLAREIHEAGRLIQAFSDRAEAPLLRRWLDGQWVRAGEAGEAIDRAVKLLAKQRPDIAGFVSQYDEINRGIYSAQSKAAHHRRSHVQSSVSGETRTARRGPNDDWMARAVTTSETMATVEEGLQCVGISLACFWPDFHERHVMPMSERFVQLRPNHPLPPDG